MTQPDIDVSAPFLGTQVIPASWFLDVKIKKLSFKDVAARLVQRGGYVVVGARRMTDREYCDLGGLYGEQLARTDRLYTLAGSERLYPGLDLVTVAEASALLGQGKLIDSNTTLPLSRFLPIRTDLGLPTDPETRDN